MLNMSRFALVLLIAVIAVVYAEEKYTTKYDNVNIDEILKSDRLFNNYFKCLVDTGKCTPDARELKRILPDALKTECKKCSPKQRESTDKVLRYVVKNKQKEWKELTAKYDPEGIYTQKYKNEAERQGITL